MNKNLSSKRKINKFIVVSSSNFPWVRWDHSFYRELQDKTWYSEALISFVLDLLLDGILNSLARHSQLCPVTLYSLYSVFSLSSHVRRQATHSQESVHIPPKLYICGPRVVARLWWRCQNKQCLVLRYQLSSQPGFSIPDISLWWSFLKRKNLSN